ncbi:MAG TPA: [acyl-carrier-protein] S-malonyltransferase [Desulfobacteraceae bacterium]|nr:[acyl-carrier-protein] S-malonyltransferase [Desulfobacteraceae bacterium]
MKTIAFLFPGQGSQSVGMGLELYQQYDTVREIFDMTEEISKIPISKLCFQGPMEELTMTVNLQPAITAVNLACLAVIRKEGVNPSVCAGHSLGEYSALCAAGIISKEDCIRLVCKRGEVMHRESLKHQGAMSAIMGLSIDKVAALAKDARKKGVVSVANHNSETQIVITGSPEGVKELSNLASSQGAKAIPLKVSGAWHSELMKGAEEEFRQFLSSVPFKKSEISVIHNVTADVAAKPEEIREIMARQLCSPVRWHDTMIRLINDKTENYAEIGPGKVLTGLLKKALPKGTSWKVLSVSDMKSLEQFLNGLE